MEKVKMEGFKGSIYLLCAFTLAGTSVISARFVSSRLGTFTIASASLFFAFLFLLPLCKGKIKETIRLMKGRGWLLLLCQAFFGIFLFRMFLLQGLLHTSTSEAGILTGATPAVTALLARILLKERVNSKSILGIACTILGILLIQGILFSGNRFTLEHFSGNVLVLCAAVSESLFNTVSRINSLEAATYNKQPLDPMVQTTLVSGIALLLCIIPSLFEHPVKQLSSLGLKEWLALLWYGLFVTALAFIFWYAGIKRCTAYTAAAFSGMMPFTSLILSVILLGENAGPQQWSGGMLVISGMLLIGNARSKIPDSSAETAI